MQRQRAVRSYRDDQRARRPVYRKEGKTLVAIGSWADQPVDVQLVIDWKELGLEPDSVTITAPEIERLQVARTFKVGEPIPIEPKKGWVLVLGRG